MAEEQSKEIARFADVAMYDAEPLPETSKDARGRPLPNVWLLSATPDPLGSIAATCMMYEGKVVRSLNDVTDDQRKHYFAQVQKTHLQAPFEFVDLHFIVEGVTRSLTHQMVRQRTAVYAQESLRFAVKDDIVAETALPPSLTELADDDPKVQVWDSAVKTMQGAYEALIGGGVPAEDARGLLPHNITTRLHYKTNLRNLLEHAGNRLCTQAQFEWRLLWLRFVDAIRNYEPHQRTAYFSEALAGEMNVVDRWQWEKLADIFRPICYLTGKCEFKASFDRACSIRERVDANAAAGRPSSEWDRFSDTGALLPILPQEWLLDPTAARVTHDHA